MLMQGAPSPRSCPRRSCHRCSTRYPWLIVAFGGRVVYGGDSKGWDNEDDREDDGDDGETADSPLSSLNAANGRKCQTTFPLVLARDRRLCERRVGTSGAQRDASRLLWTWSSSFSSSPRLANSHVLGHSPSSYDAIIAATKSRVHYGLRTIHGIMMLRSHRRRQHMAHLCGPARLPEHADLVRQRASSVMLMLLSRRLPRGPQATQ